jgi:hypothetical protein
VVGPAGTEAIGSITRYAREDLPLDGAFSEYEGQFAFYLVRGTADYYAVTTDFLGNGTRCDLQVEPASLVFSCPDAGWKWDRYGRVLRRGEPWPDGLRDLLVLPVVESWDGNLMVDPFGNSPEAAVNAWMAQ